jgi:hypothetical protein
MDKFGEGKESLQLRYFDKEENKFNNIDKDISDNLINLIDSLNEKNRIVYRGFSKKFVNYDFWKWIFTVGEKGSHFRGEVLGVGSEDKLNYFSNHSVTAEDNYKNLLNNMKNDIFPKYKYKNLINGIDTLEERIEKFRIDNKRDYTEMYYILLSWLHNIGHINECPEYKKDSPFISTSTSLDIALSFNDKDSCPKYAFVVILSDSNISDYFYTKRLNELLKGFNIKWHKDKNKEVMFKDAIFPHLIIGILEKKSDETNFIINPGLRTLLKSKIPNSFKENFLIKSGIPINQKDFDDGLNALKYNSYVEQMATERIICKDSKNFPVGTIKKSS